MKFLSSVALALAVCAMPCVPAFGQTSNKPINLVVPFSPGGGTDILARIVGPRLGQKLGVPVVVENRPGAAGAIGALYTAKAVPDGSTLMIGSISELGINPSLYPKLPYDVMRDFTAITPMAATPMVLAVNVSSPIRKVQDLIGMAEKNPGKLNFGSAGTGSGAHMAAELFMYETKIKLTHIPYKGTGAAVQGLLGTERDMVLFTTLPSVVSLVAAGQLRAVALSSSGAVAAFPGVPTFGQAGVPGFDMEYWYGLVGPAGLPAGVRARLHDVMADILRQPDVVQSLDKQGLLPKSGTSAEFREFIKGDIAKWGKVVKAAHITLQE